MVAQRLVVGDAEGPRRESLGERLARHRPAGRSRPRRRGRVGAALGLGPGHPHPGRALHRRQPGRGRPGRVPRVRGQDRAGERLVDRLAVVRSARRTRRGRRPAAGRSPRPAPRRSPRRRRTRPACARRAPGAPPRSRPRRRRARPRTRRRRPAGERVERRDDQPLLAAPELGLALPLEERGDRLAELALEQLVGVDHPEAEPLGDGVRRPRLARRHEPDEDDPVVRPRYLRHPMRSL